MIDSCYIKFSKIRLKCLLFILILSAPFLVLGEGNTSHKPIGKKSQVYKSQIFSSNAKLVNAKNRFKTDVYQIMTFYSSQSRWWEDMNCILDAGCQGHEGIWFWAHAQYLLASYQEITNDKYFVNKLTASYKDNWGRIWGRRYLDDSLWWSLALIKDYEVTGDKLALKKAEALVGFVLRSGHQNICHGNGGIYWDSTKTQVGSIANELLIVASSRLYMITHKEKYKDIANETWSWFKHSGLINQDFTVADHYAIDNNGCGNKLDWHFSYNSGLLLRALASLYKINNSNQKYLDLGKKIANAAMHDYTMGGVITENCTNVMACADDGFMFKGIYAYDLANFALITKDKQFRAKVRHYLTDSYESLITINKTVPTIYPFNWSLPTDFGRSSPLYNPSDIVTYLSGIYLELAYLKIMES